ncbi:MAG: hypothetical protein HOV83_38780, partial [Catenulispora sp.]|nr:hypothetical protein [Catenulispora sp.]
MLKQQSRKNKTGRRIRMTGLVAVVTAVGLTAACSAAKESKGAPSTPRGAEGIGNNAVPGTPTFTPTQCGPEATAARWPDPLPG